MEILGKHGSNREAQMLKILGRKTSGTTQKVLWCCDELGITYEREDVGRTSHLPFNFTLVPRSADRCTPAAHLARPTDRNGRIARVACATGFWVKPPPN